MNKSQSNRSVEIRKTEGSFKRTSLSVSDGRYEADRCIVSSKLREGITTLIFLRMRDRHASFLSAGGNQDENA